MDEKKHVVYIFLISMILGQYVFADASAPNFSKTEKYFSSINQPNNKKLNTFLIDMPKGGDLHNHLMGAAYPKWLISYAKNDTVNWCVDPIANYTVSVNNNCTNTGGILLNTISQDSQAYNTIVSQWSMEGFNLAAPWDLSAPWYGHDHFFGAFVKFNSLAKQNAASIIADLVHQAEQENIHYLEIMVRTDTGNHTIEHYAQYVTTLPSNPNNINYDDVVAAIQQLEQHNFTSNVVKNTIIPQAQQLLAVVYDLLSGSSASTINVKLQYTANRSKPFAEVLTGLYAGFSAATESDLFVGINMIGPEDSSLALNNYYAHMMLIRYMQKYFNDSFNSKVNISLHAGELTQNLLTIAQKPLFDLTYHINNATEVADANRIGHGIDLFAELHYHTNLTTAMKNYPNTIEICLTSNEQILGVCDGEPYCIPPIIPYNLPNQYKFNHPFYYYLISDVPVTICTDDQGIEQTNLTNEYYKAVSRYGLTYKQLKDISRNSLAFSFLPGQPLWTAAGNGKYTNFVSQCANDDPYVKTMPSVTCQAYLNNNTKAKLEWELEEKFSQFEDSVTPKGAASAPKANVLKILWVTGIGILLIY